MMIARGVLTVLAMASLAVPCLPQVQVAKLLRSDGNTHTFGGSSFAISGALEGDTAVVGSFKDSSVSQSYGAAYVFDIAAGPNESQKLVPAGLSGSALFGWRVAFDGEWLAITAKQDSSMGVLAGGSVVLYRRTAPGSPFVQDQKIWASDPKTDARLGESLAMWNNRLIVGAQDDWTLGLSAGAAYIFELQPGGTWVQRAKLLASDGWQGDIFGAAVAIHGDHALVSAPGKDDPSIGNDVGAIYAFERDAQGAWAQVQKFKPDRSQASQSLGYGLALSQDEAFVPATAYDEPGLGTNTGAVFVFARTPGGWSQSQKLRIQDPNSELYFGGPVLAGDRLFVTVGLDDNQLPGAGSVYVFERNASGWVQAAKVLADDGTLNDNLGMFASASDGRLLVGAFGTDDACPTNPNCNSGAAYVFRLPQNTYQHCFCKSPAGPCGNHDDFGGCRGSSGQGAVLSAAGSGSVALDDLELQGRWMPAGDFALLFMGASNQTSGPFADGRLCIGAGAGGLHRFPVSVTSGTGSLLLGPGLAAHSQSFPLSGQIQPGQTWHFQLWFRDFAGPCGTGSNLSNALQVDFRP